MLEKIILCAGGISLILLNKYIAKLFSWWEQEIYKLDYSRFSELWSRTLIILIGLLLLSIAFIRE